MVNHVHIGDIPDGLSFGDRVAVDTEAMGLNNHRDRLCVVQLSSGDGDAHLVHFRDDDFSAPNLKKLMSDKSIEKIFHFARFDVAILKKYLQVDVAPIFCTKIASKLCRTYTDKHGLKDLCKEIINIDLSKKQQSSYWGADELSAAQIEYAASDVLYLHEIRDELEVRLGKEDRLQLAKDCMGFITTRTELDLLGWVNSDIFSHAG